MKKLSALALMLVMAVSGNVFAAEAATGGDAVATASTAAGGAAPGGAAQSGMSSGALAALSAAEIGLGVAAAVVFVTAASQSTSTVAH